MFSSTCTMQEEEQRAQIIREKKKHYINNLIHFPLVFTFVNISGFGKYFILSSC